MNILLLYSTPFVETDSFYWFYQQLVDQIGDDSQLFFAYLNNSKGVVNGIQLPDNHSYNTLRNIKALTTFIKDHKVSVLFNFYLPYCQIGGFLTAVKKQVPELKMVELIHNCPNHTVLLKEYSLKNIKSGFIPTSTKDKVAKLFPNVYLYFLKKKVRKDNRRAYELHDAVVLLSPSYISEYLSLINKKKSNKVFAIPNSTAPLHFCKSEIPVEAKSKEIIFCGRLDIEKAIPILLRVWERIQNQIPDWKFVLIGDGAQMHLCKELARKLKLERIEFIGRMNSKPLIDEASILCLTSVIEGLPTVFLEAMTMGVVPVGFDSFSAIYDMIDNWENGVIVPAFDMDMYEKSLLRLATDKELRCKMGRNAQQKVVQYNIFNIVPKWISLFKYLKLV